jgi:pantoate--beta-alanine ligase
MSLTVFDRLEPYRKALETERAAGRTVGLVPTMGALHAGHVSLIHRAALDCDVVAVTIFVNPLQFAPGEDLTTYPRDPEGDRAQISEAGATYLLAPPMREMFAEPPLTSVTVGRIGESLEGASRPGHFTGVATIVAKLFAVSGACRAYFGEKDYQQLAVIRRMVADLGLPVDVVGCPTVRDADGLALSSRNAYLSPDERAAAPTLYQALLAGGDAIGAGQRDPGSIRAAMAEVVAREPKFTLDYAEVTAADLTPIDTVAGEVRLLIAARIGTARLIDNLGAHA